MSVGTEEEIEQVQVHIDQVKEAIDLADKLQVLENIPEFQDLIIDGFMKGEPARIATIITDPNLLGEEDQRELLGALKAVGYLGDYLRNIFKRGVQMKAALAQAEEYQTSLRAPSEGDL